MNALCGTWCEHCGHCLGCNNHDKAKPETNNSLPLGSGYWCHGCSWCEKFRVDE